MVCTKRERGSLKRVLEMVLELKYVETMRTGVYYPVISRGGSGFSFNTENNNTLG